MQRFTKIIITIDLTFGIVGGAIACGKAKFGDSVASGENILRVAIEKLALNQSHDHHRFAL